MKNTKCDINLLPFDRDDTALRAGAAVVLRNFLAAGGDPETAVTCASERMPMLTAAAAGGWNDAVRMLLAAGANVRANDDWALRWAAFHGYAEIVGMLLAAGADVHADHDAAVRWAARNGHLAAIDCLLAAGGHANAREGGALDGGALHNAALEGHLSVVERLLAAGADVHADRDAAVRWAARRGHVPVIDCLIAAGADHHANHDEALQLASARGDLPVIRSLLVAGINANHEMDTARALGIALGNALANGCDDAAIVLMAAGANAHDAWRSSKRKKGVVVSLNRLAASIPHDQRQALLQRMPYRFPAVQALEDAERRVTKRTKQGERRMQGRG